MNELKANTWHPLQTKKDYSRLPKGMNFRCLFDDGTECNYYDDLPRAVMTHWK